MGRQRLRYLGPFDPRHLDALDWYIQDKLGDPSAKWYEHEQLIPKSNPHYKEILKYRKNYANHRQYGRQSRSDKGISKFSWWVVTDHRTQKKYKFKTNAEVANFIGCSLSHVRKAKTQQLTVARRYTIDTIK